MFAIWLIIFAGCFTAQDVRECASAYLATVKGDIRYTAVYNGARDTINKWIDLGIRKVQVLKTVDWRIDSLIFFDRSMDRCLLLVVEEDPDSSARLNYAQLIGGEWKEQQWHFFFAGFPFFTVRKELSDEEQSKRMDRIAYRVIKSLAKSGLFVKGTCEINSAYIDQWFTDELYKSHKDWLISHY